MGDRYLIRKNRESWVEITELDTIARIVRGKFELYLEIEDKDDKRIPTNPNKIKLKEGTFDLKFVD